MDYLKCADLRCRALEKTDDDSIPPRPQTVDEDILVTLWKSYAEQFSQVTIQVDETHEKGARFVVELPIAPET